nr:SDR family oxidoreductase [Microbacterium bovistercoris]
MTDELFDVRGKVALVTGGTGGIGGMIARGFVSRGVRTYLVGRDPQKTTDVAAAVSGDDGDCRPLVADLADPAQVAALAAEFARHEERLHILVNNAGAVGPDSLDASTTQAWDDIMELNVRTPFQLVQGLLAPLRAAASVDDPARIVNIGSIGGLHVPNWEAHAYGASKAALHHLTRSLAKKLGHDSITVNAIAPGPFPTSMTSASAETVRKNVQTYIPLARAGEEHDMQGLVLFLSSRAGAYVNGVTIPLDGGYMAAL